MTYDKLKDKIYWHWKNAYDSEFYGLGGYRKALRAVVELHKPYTEQVAYAICTTCQCLYPCPTIQAIEKELS